MKLTEIGCGATMQTVGAVTRTWQCSHRNPLHRAMHSTTVTTAQGVLLAGVVWKRRAKAVANVNDGSVASDAEVWRY